MGRTYASCSLPNCASLTRNSGLKILSPVVSVSKASDLRFLRTKSANALRSFSFSTTRIVFGPYRRVFIMPPLQGPIGGDSPANRGCPTTTDYLLLFHTGLHPDSRPAGQNHPDQLPRALVPDL